MTIEEAFGIVLRRLRRERNLSQDKLSLSSSLDRAFISKIEGGKQQPSLVTIFELANALNVTASSILFEVEFILNIHCPHIFKFTLDNEKADTMSFLEKIMSDNIDSYRGAETILIADDEKLMRDMMSDYLVELGYSVITAEDGQDAIDKFKQHRVDLIIMDVVMPRKDGITAFKELKEMQSDLKILLTSGYHADYLTKSDNLEIIKKPYSPVEIIKMIRNIFDNNWIA